MSDVCYLCGDKFSHIGAHWARSYSCDWPSLPPHLREVVTGLLMGDGNMHQVRDKTPFLRAQMSNKEYLSYLDRLFDWFSRGVELSETAQESAKRSRDRGFSPNASPENYSDIYMWQSRSHPEMYEWLDWYSSGRKVWPEDIDLTPTVLKHWFCGDGHFEREGVTGHIEIALANERKNKEKIEKMFNRVGLEIGYWVDNERESGRYDCSLCFTTEQSSDIWDYMGEPLPGFQYKWPKEKWERVEGNDLLEECQYE